QADVIIGIEERFKIGKEIPNLAAIKKALASDQMVRDAGLTKRGFQGPGLHVGAKKNSMLGPGYPVGGPRVAYLLDQCSSFGLIVRECVKCNLWSLSLVGPEILAATAQVVFDDRVGGFEDSRG